MFHGLWSIIASTYVRTWCDWADDMDHGIRNRNSKSPLNPQASGKQNSNQWSKLIQSSFIPPPWWMNELCHYWAINALVKRAHRSRTLLQTEPNQTKPLQQKRLHSHPNGHRPMLKRSRGVMAQKGHIAANSNAVILCFQHPLLWIFNNWIL